MFNKEATEYTLKNLKFKKRNLENELDRCNRMIICKKNAEENGMEAEFYENNFVAGFQVLNEPLSFYQEKKDTVEKQLECIGEELSQFESKSFSNTLTMS